jgi:hypothetical protein
VSEDDLAQGVVDRLQNAIELMKEGNWDGAYLEICESTLELADLIQDNSDNDVQ